MWVEFWTTFIVSRAYWQLFVQRSLLLGQRVPYRVPRIKSRLTVYKSMPFPLCYLLGPPPINILTECVEINSTFIMLLLQLTPFKIFVYYITMICKAIHNKVVLNIQCSNSNPTTTVTLSPPKPPISSSSNLSFSRHKSNLYYLFQENREIIRKLINESQLMMIVIY